MSSDGPRKKLDAEDSPRHALAIRAEQRGRVRVGGVGLQAAGLCDVRNRGRHPSSKTSVLHASELEKKEGGCAGSPRRRRS
jgi:hypothetical protein